MAAPAQKGLAPGFSVRELTEEAEREAFLRRRVYPGQVARGRMTQRDADREIDLMEAIATRLRATAHL